MCVRRIVSMPSWKIFLVFLLAGGLAAVGQTGKTPQPTPNQKDNLALRPSDDISGMYTFLHEGEFLQITVEEDGVSGYISRMGDQDSDHGSFLDQFFSKASVQGHDVSFTTKVLHGTWFEFKGRYERGTAKSKAEDGYFVLRGTLTELAGTDEKNSTRTHSQQVSFKWMAQPDEDEEHEKPPRKK
jgi:hypothetical protein